MTSMKWEHVEAFHWFGKASWVYTLGFVLFWVFFELLFVLVLNKEGTELLIQLVGLPGWQVTMDNPMCFSWANGLIN